MQSPPASSGARRSPIAGRATRYRPHGSAHWRSRRRCQRRLMALSPFTSSADFRPPADVPFLGYYRRTTFETLSHVIELMLVSAARFLRRGLRPASVRECSDSALRHRGTACSHRRAARRAGDADIEVAQGGIADAIQTSPTSASSVLRRVGGNLARRTRTDRVRRVAARSYTPGGDRLAQGFRPLGPRAGAHRSCRRSASLEEQRFVARHRQRVGEASPKFTCSPESDAELLQVIVEVLGLETAPLEAASSRPSRRFVPTALRPGVT